MGVPAAVRKFFDQTRPGVSTLDGNVRAAVTNFCDSEHYLYIGRRKSLASLSEKLEGGRIGRFSEIDDLFACTVVVPTATHIQRVVAFLDQAYERRSLRTRDDVLKPPDVFRFESARYVANLRKQVGIEYAGSAERIAFEVQIPTVFEYAWQVVTHDLVYKSSDIDWRRLRLAAQLKAAVEQIEMVIGAFEASASAIPLSSWPSTEAEIRIVEHFRRLVSEGIVPVELVPDSWNRFAQNVSGLVGSYIRDRRDVPAAIDRLLEACEVRLKAGQPAPALSGSLFQYVVGTVGDSAFREGSLDRYSIVESEELAEFYGLKGVPRAVQQDWDEGVT